MLTRLQSWDRRAFSAVHRADTPLLDAALPPLTKSADHGRLWLGVAALLAVTGRRRADWRISAAVVRVRCASASTLDIAQGVCEVVRMDSHSPSR